MEDPKICKIWHKFHLSLFKKKGILNIKLTSNKVSLAMSVPNSGHTPGPGQHKRYEICRAHNHTLLMCLSNKLCWNNFWSFSSVLIKNNNTVWSSNGIQLILTKTVISNSCVLQVDTFSKNKFCFFVCLF